MKSHSLIKSSFIYVQHTKILYNPCNHETVHSAIDFPRILSVLKYLQSVPTTASNKTVHKDRCDSKRQIYACSVYMAECPQFEELMHVQNV